MIYFPDSTKVPFILSHAHHSHVILFLPYTVLSQSVLLGLRFFHNSVFSFPPTLCPDWKICLALSIITYVHYIFNTTRMYFKRYFIPLHPHVSLRLIIYITVLYWSRSHSFIRFGGSELLSCFPIKGVTGKCNPWLHFTPQ